MSPKPDSKLKMPVGLSRATTLVAALVCLSICFYPKPASAQLGCDVYAAVAAFLGFAGQADAEDACINAVGHWTDHFTQYIKAKIDQQRSQMHADATKEYLKQVADAKRTVDAYVASDQSTTCATTMAMQSRSVMEDFSAAGAAMGQAVVNGRGTGPNANESGFNAKTERLCELAEFICPQSNRYGPDLATVVQKCQNANPCPNNGLYADADISPESLLMPRQLVIPQNMTRRNDGHIIINTTSDADIRFKAAWEVCENAALMSPTPPHQSGTPTAQYIALMADERPLALLLQGSVSKCFEFLFRRIACPASTNFSTGNSVSNVSPLGNITDCHTAQAAACHRLKDPLPNGMNLAGDNGLQMDSKTNYAFNNCDRDGLSLEMYDYIYSHRCMVADYATKVVPAEHRGDTAESEKALATCRAEAPRYEEWLETDKAALKQSFRDIAQMRGVAIGIMTPAAQTVH